MKKTVYKLTTQDNKTRVGEMNETQWGLGCTFTADGQSDSLCNSHWIHAYADPLLAVFMNPAHANIRNPVLWECDAKVGLDHADKLGCTSLTTLKICALPEVTTEQQVRFAVLAALSVYRLWKKY
ncbi:MAG: hypothetical protein ABFD89_19440, partial [Bryobacteraceae bacterium]